MNNKLYLEDVWNDITVAVKRGRPHEPRQHIYASEIGKSFFDRYHKMIGTPETEMIDDRVLRKFTAGEVFEELIGDYLSMIGLIKSSQEHIEIPENEKHLRITGRIDYIAGMSDWKAAREKIGNGTTEEYSDITKEILLKLIERLEQKYPNGISDTLFEIKTINSMVFWAKKHYLTEAYPWHVMQIYTYLKQKGMSEGRIVYVSKDDLTIKELTITYPNAELEAVWQKDVETMSDYLRKGVEPPKPPSVIFDKRGSYPFQKNGVKHKCEGLWKENWEVKFSSYFRMITGFESEDKWLYSLRSEISERNKELKEKFIKENHL